MYTHSRVFYFVSYNIDNYKPFYVHLRAKSRNTSKIEAYLPPMLYYKPRRFISFSLDTVCLERGSANIEITLSVQGYSNMTFIQKRFCRSKDTYDYLVSWLFILFLMVLLIYHLGVFIAA